MDAAAIKTSAGRERKGDGSKSYAASCSLKADRTAMKKIELAKNDIKAGKTRSLKDIIKNG